MSETSHVDPPVDRIGGESIERPQPFGKKNGDWRPRAFWFAPVVTRWTGYAADATLAGLTKCLGQRVDTLIQLGVLDQYRWKEPDHRSTTGEDEHALLLHRLDDGRGRLLQLDRQHQAAPADLADLAQAEFRN